MFGMRWETKWIRSTKTAGLAFNAIRSRLLSVGSERRSTWEEIASKQCNTMISSASCQMAALFFTSMVACLIRQIPPNSWNTWYLATQLSLFCYSSVGWIFSLMAPSRWPQSRFIRSLLSWFMTSRRTCMFLSCTVWCPTSYKSCIGESWNNSSLSLVARLMCVTTPQILRWPSEMHAMTFSLQLIILAVTFTSSSSSQDGRPQVW